MKNSQTCAGSVPAGGPRPGRGVHRGPGGNARARLRAIAFLEVQSEFWDAAGPHDSELQKLMDFMEGLACADADFSSSQSAERRFG